MRTILVLLLIFVACPVNLFAQATVGPVASELSSGTYQKVILERSPADSKEKKTSDALDAQWKTDCTAMDTTATGTCKLDDGTEVTVTKKKTCVPNPAAKQGNGRRAKDVKVSDGQATQTLKAGEDKCKCTTTIEAAEGKTCAMQDEIETVYNLSDSDLAQIEELMSFYGIE